MLYVVTLPDVFESTEEGSRVGFFARKPVGVWVTILLEGKLP